MSTTSEPWTETAPPPQAAGHTPVAERLQSLDAFRGFDMFWISGGDFLFHALALTTGWAWAVGFAKQLEHSHWAGCTPYDMIMPIFLFITGITLPLGVTRRMARGQTRWEIFRRLLFRAIVLAILGFYDLDNNEPAMGSLIIDHIRFCGILQRIGVAGLAAGTIMMFTNLRGQILWVVGILGGYWALLNFVAPPGQPAPIIQPGLNIVDYLDKHVMPGHLVAGTHDGAGWFSDPPAVALVLMGAIAGAWLLSPGSPGRKVLGLVGGGVGLLIVGRLWAIQFPMVKSLFTSSYVIYTAGWACLLLAFFYGIIDGLGWRRWSFPLRLIGLNPLTIYFLTVTGLINFPYVTQFFFWFLFHRTAPVSAWTASTAGWLYPNFVPSTQPFWQLLLMIGVELLFLYWLYRRKIFWRV